MNQKFYGSNNKTWSYVGCSKFSQGWERLFKRLSRHKNAFELDESAFDSSLFREAMYGQIDIRFSFLSHDEQTDENYRRLTALYVEIVDSIIVASAGDLFTKNTGNPSGSANTIVDNTMILFRFFCYAWIMLWRKQFPGEQPCYDDMIKHVEAALNGDDNTWTCDDEVLPWFNATTVSGVWSEIGVVTHADHYEPRELIQCWFLSMGFKVINGVHVPYPENEKVMCALAYSHFSRANSRISLLRAYALRIDSFFILNQES